MSGKPVAIVTNVTEYAGPASVAALIAAGRDVLCHDQKFVSEPLRLEYEARVPGAVASTNLEPEQLVDEAMARFGRLDAVISNDFTLLQGRPVDEIGAETFRAFFEALTVFPFRLCAAAAGVMKPQRRGQIVLITSGAGVSNPVSTFAEGKVLTAYITAREATNAMARSLAVELAAFGIQVNAVAVSRLYSQTFFPSPLGAEDPKFKAALEARVPMRRWGRDEEMSALITLLASGEATFVSGQVIAFSGAAA